MKFVSAAGEQELDSAIEAIEAVPSAEVVIAIRPRARAWLVQHALVGIVTAIAMLAFTLYSDAEFALRHILVLPILAFRMFPDSDAAKGAKEGEKVKATPDQIAFANLMRGIHF